MVRECDDSNICKLMTYKEVCENRGDCLKTNLAVSQLKHTYDWSSVYRKSCDLSGSIYLTSLSMNPNDGKISVSYIMSRFAHALNENGLGKLTNYLSTVPSKISEMIVHFQAFVSKYSS